MKGYDQYINGYDKCVKGYDKCTNDYDKYMKGYNFKHIIGYDKYTKDFYLKTFTATPRILTAIVPTVLMVSGVNWTKWRRRWTT